MVYRKNSAVNFTIRELDGSKIGRIHDRVHVQRLIPYCKTSRNFKIGANNHVTVEHLEKKNDEVSVERKDGFKSLDGMEMLEVLDQRFQPSGESQYLVKWGEIRFWVSRENVEKGLLKEFNERLRVERASRRLRR